jgi:hypothetical protein
VKPKPRIPFYWWPFWMLLLVLALTFFYGVLTPVWMGLRAVAWVSEHPLRPRWTAWRT